MSSDKNLKDLGKYLKVLQQPIRREILKILNFNENPIPFSILQKEVLNLISNPKSINFSFHLNSLKNISLISSIKEGYSLTNLGKTILKFILNMESVLNENKKPIMIRTSKYSKEPFDLTNVEKYLIHEGKLEKSLAKNIAKQVKKRLSTTRIRYLTAPLMREFINAILLENDLEDVRHRLTRLGAPPSEVTKYYYDGSINPINFINILGSDVSEQFLLLNLLPKNIADLFLSGEIILLHLNYWALRPLSIYLHTESILEKIFSNYSPLTKNFKNVRDSISFILKFINYLKILRPYFSEDILLNNFNTKLLTNFYGLDKESLSFIYKVLTSQFLAYNEFNNVFNSHLSLVFNYPNNNDSFDEKSSLLKVDNLFFKKFYNAKSVTQKHHFPLIIFDYFDVYSSNSCQTIFDDLLSSINFNKTIFYNHNSSTLLNSTNINVKSQNFNENRVIIDKISINLYKVAQKSNQNDSVFFDLIKDKVNSIFEFFNWKITLLSKKVCKSNDWEYIINNLLNKKMKNWQDEAIKSISFMGLNEAILEHCGIELDRTQSSERFALKILTLLNDLIKEKNEVENNYYTLSQPFNFNFTNNMKNIHIRLNSIKNSHDLLKIIRNDSKLTLEKKIALFKKFEKLLNGGSLFIYNPEGNKFPNKESLKYLFESNLQAFTIQS